ncbi:transcription repressor OFP17-like [Salvia miltiorrhiza]|uniref:transcription repressor OFP17-like n=1 Tax=Salvia miltiorrhiza TaxID=226208 RepID=UPI0025ACDCAC|nr:transcription repressor OFP17-like [Salvia miltiorrhiza]
MKSKYLSIASLKRKLLKPCKKIVKFIIKLRPRKPLSIKSLRLRRRGGRLSKMMTVFRSPRDEREMDRVTELTSFSQRAPHPSPLTPAYIRMSAKAGEEEDDHVEEACRSFEKYLVEMIVEEGKVRDLGDVEELLYCWEELRSPVFLALVCRFYRELCTDLFSANHLQT